MHILNSSVFAATPVRESGWPLKTAKGIAERFQCGSRSTDTGFLDSVILYVSPFMLITVAVRMKEQYPKGQSIAQSLVDRRGTCDGIEAYSTKL